MSYKGNDLDLRAPYAPHGRDANGSEEAGASASWSMPPEHGRDGPIPVDQTLLACCNAAYDAALFHGARDVRLEHLLYALTRIDAARDVLEQHGVRAHQLRRDAAAAIAGDAPAAGSGGRAPRSSTEFENVLRRAAGRAGQDHVPASVHDLMRALLSYGREAPATTLFLRSANDPQQLERWGAEPPAAQHGVSLHAAAALQPAAAQELPGRLETMETAMRTLTAEVVADRKAMLDLMSEMHHELRAARAENTAAPPAIVLDKLEDVGKSMTGLAERFEAIRAFAPGDGLTGRMAALESRFSEQPAAIADAVAYMLTERGAGAEEALHLAGDGDTPAAGAATERLSGLEAMLRTQAERMEDASKTHERDLNEIFEALVKLGTNQQTLANNLEAWRLDSSGDVSIVSNRLENMERTLQEVLVPPRPVRLIEESPASQEAGTEGDAARTRTFKRWLYGTGRVLPSSWREDAAALRESLRSTRRTGRT